MFYSIYKTTNTVNGKHYIGKHQTEDLNDNYLGSGRALTMALKKYGHKAFTKETLFVFETEKEMNDKEIEIVTPEFISRKDNYNAGVGGKGGAQFTNKKHTQETKDRIRLRLIGKSFKTVEGRNNIAKSNSTRIISDETKRKLSEKQHLAQERKRNIAG